MERLAGLDESVTGLAGGLHVVVTMTPERETALMSAATERGIGVAPLSVFAHPSATDPVRSGLVVGFGTPPPSSYAADLDALVGLLREVK